MNPSTLLVTALLIAAPLHAQPNAEPSRVASAADLAWLRDRMEAIRQRHDLPDLGAVVVIQDQVVAAPVVGVRKYGTGIAAEPDDPFHLGSITKVMTATLAGMMVDDGLLRWDMTMEEMFPELVAAMQPGYRKVTVTQLLSHTGGFPFSPGRPIGEITASAPDDKGRRYEFVKAAVADLPQATPGEKVIYSGGGIIVMSYVERKLGTTYEDLLRKRLFEPLGMKSAGIGDHMPSRGTTDAPWGHRQRGGVTEAEEPDPAVPSNGRSPVGGVYCAMPDFGRFLALHLNAARGRARLLKPETFRHLQTVAPGGSFAPGWSVEGWEKGPVFFHSGSIGLHVALCWVMPAEGFAIAVGTNAAGDPRADLALGELFGLLMLKLHQGSGLRPPAPSPDVWLDQALPLSAAVGYGKFQAGRNIEGGPLVSESRIVKRGLGIHAPSELAYDVPADASRFVARFVAGERWRTSLRAEVYLDGTLLDTTPLMQAFDAAWSFNLPLPLPDPAGTAPRRLRLVVSDGGDGADDDWGTWLDAGFVTDRK